MMLALSVYQIIINEKLPTTSDAVPLLGKSDRLVYRRIINDCIVHVYF